MNKKSKFKVGDLIKYFSNLSKAYSYCVIHHIEGPDECIEYWGYWCDTPEKAISKIGPCGIDDAMTYMFEDRVEFVAEGPSFIVENETLQEKLNSLIKEMGYEK